MTRGTLHVVFTPSGAKDLKHALATAGRDDQVISSFDHLGFGPINPPDLSLRSKWVENELGWTGWDDIAPETEAFWREALSPGRRKVAWLSRRSAMEYTGFLEWLWRMGDAPCEVVDLSEVKVSRSLEHGRPPPPALAISLGIVPSGIICRDGLWDLAEPLRPAAREKYRNLWQKLRSESAPLRIIDGDELVSTPISAFDARLMSYVTADWQRVATVVGQALAAEMDECVFQTVDVFLAARIDAMVGNGRLDLQGNSAREMHNSQVRLARTQ